MSVCYKPGQVLGQGDLDIHFTDSDCSPMNVYSITYSLYYVDPGPPETEVLICPADRTPVNPSVGSYYAAIMVPPSAIPGCYRIRWTFVDVSGGVTQTAVEEFNVCEESGASIFQMSDIESEMVNQLRMFLRDHCVGGEEEIEIDIKGTRSVVSLEELWEAVQIDGPRRVPELATAYEHRLLKVRSVSPRGKVEWKSVLDVSRSDVPWETIYVGRTKHGDFVLTGGHRVYTSPTSKTEMDTLRPHMRLLSVPVEGISWVEMTEIESVGNRKWMFDLTAEDYHNFVLYRSKVVVSNSPDRNYHFRPPEHEGRINRYNRVFGQIWEDIELLQYLRWALDWWNMMPPETEKLWSIDILWSNKPVWRTSILWGAAVHALFALAVNWIHEEFSYSIGGISLDIQRSSNYSSLKENAESRWESAVEMKARTTKFIRGLQQPRYGQGIRSSFGPSLGRGVLSPRAFLS